ncbi:platelet glycoprotein V isoform X1 [Pimephales promelas]|uniref:platelet glycoprotein V isoform X1 n=2 Tax=Pimephales promelas TaxID=90988 RepID=UPI001955C680|nr:platelet glycoprotein V isoform X1 [Pimephales promelas]
MVGLLGGNIRITFLITSEFESMWVTFILLPLLPQLTLCVHCPSVCVCNVKGAAKCSGDISDIPPLDPKTTFLLLLKDTNIKVLKARSFQSFSLLLRLMITHSAIDTIQPEAFYGAPQFRSIKLSSNALSIFPPKVFSEQSNLEQLQLDDNQIVSISSELFEGLVNLTELDLSKNRISQLDAGVFQNLTKLIYLNLAGNQLRNLPKTLFHNLRQLQSLVLSSNKLVTLESGAFDHLSKLCFLLLHKNQIREIPPRLFWHLPSLLNLSMSGNQLQYIPAESFYYLPNLTMLTLFKNPLISLPDQLMGNMPRLVELYLYNTSLVTVPWNLFANMTNLRFLNLHLNDKLNLLPKDLFCCLPNLNKLSLKHNNLRALEPDLFSNLTSLQILMLNDNKLESLPATIFCNTSRLEILDLSRNHLKYLPGDVFTHTKALNVLSLGGNKWKCDCNIIGIAEWIRDNPRLINASEKGVACYEPYHLQNHSLQTLTHAELKCGQVLFQTIMTTSIIPRQVPATSTPQSSTATSTKARPTATSTTPSITSTFATTASRFYNSLLLSPIYIKQGNEYNNDLAFYEKIVLENGPDIVHNNHYGGWVYLWTVPSTGPFSGFMTALYIVLLVTGVVLIAATWYALYRLHKVMWMLQKVTMGGNQRIMARRVRSFKVKL